MAHPKLPSGPWITAGRAAWVVLFLVIIALTLTGAITGYSRLQTVCLESNCAYQLNATQVQQLQGLGLSLPAFALLFTCLVVLIAAFYIGVAFILIRRRSARWIELLGAFTLLLFGGVSFPDTTALIGQTYPVLQLPVMILDYLGSLMLPVFLVAFPDGRFRPRWTIGLIVAWSLLQIPGYFFPGSAFDLNSWSLGIQIVLWTGFIASLILVQYYRYQHFYGPILRQQTKWVVYGLMVSLGGFISIRSGLALVPAEIIDNGLLVVFSSVLSYLLMILIPLSFAISILRYNLWGIDLIINRTLVYIPLSAILGGLFSASITLCQKIFIATTGQKSDAALVITTFVIVSAFTPIKTWLQTIVDKRFKETANPLKEIHILDRQVQSVVEVLDAGLITHRLLTTAVDAFHTTGGAITLEQGGQPAITYATPGWKDEDSRLSLSLVWDGRPLGELQLGGRAGGLDYSTQERQVLQQTANRVARVITGFSMDDRASGRIMGGE